MVQVHVGARKSLPSNSEGIFFVLSSYNLIKVRICLFGDAGSIHLERWCQFFIGEGHEVHLISFTKAEVPGTKCYYVDAGPIAVQGGNWRVLFQYRKVRKIVKSIQPDVFHALYATSYGITGALVNYHPFVISSLGSDILISPRNSKILRALLRFAYRRVDASTTMSQQMKDVSISYGLPGDKIQLLPFGIDPAVFNANGRATAKEPFVIMSTRNFEEVYNIPDLIHAIALIKEQLGNFELWMAGVGTLESQIKSLVAEHGLTDKVRFLGRMRQPELADKLRNSHVFISMSSSDGNSVSLSEGMACGCVSIVSEIEANKFWIEHDKTGYFVPVHGVKELAERILAVKADYENIQKRMFEINQPLLEAKGNWFKNMRTVTDLYQRLLKQQSR